MTKESHPIPHATHSGRTPVENAIFRGELTQGKQKVTTGEAPLKKAVEYDAQRFKPRILLPNFPAQQEDAELEDITSTYETERTEPGSYRPEQINLGRKEE